MNENLILSSDLANKGVIGLDDCPSLTTNEMQKKFDELVIDVVVPKHNAVVNELSNDYADKQYVAEQVLLTGAADMTKAVYDSDLNGVVDDAERLGGEIPSYYATKAQANDNTANAFSTYTYSHKSFLSAAIGTTYYNSLDNLADTGTLAAAVNTTEILSENEVSGNVYFEVENGGNSVYFLSSDVTAVGEHALDLLGGGSNIKFVATTDYAEGDAIIVNGVTVTTRIQGSEDSLPDVFWRSGDVISCFLNGTTLNFKRGSVISPMLSFTYSGTFTQLDDSVTATTTVSLGTVSVTASTFKAQISAKGTYTFTHNGTNWTYGGNTVTLSDYGINLSEGTPASGNTITVVSGDAHTRVKFLTSGTLRFTKKPPLLDVFMVGGGGNGGAVSQGGGGGGGYTLTALQVQLQRDTDYSIVVGGAAGNTTGFGYTAVHGNSGAASGMANNLNTYPGGSGGSGGGAGCYGGAGYYGGSDYGGSNGGDGGNGGSGGAGGGQGQGTTTYEFAEIGTTLYSGGGSGHTSHGDNSQAYGGKGGGGSLATGAVNGVNGLGGGGAGYLGSGGSGVVIIRDARGA